MSGATGIASLPGGARVPRKFRWKPILALAVIAAVAAASWPEAPDSTVAEAVARPGRADAGPQRTGASMVPTAFAFPVRAVRAPRADLFGSQSWRPAPPPEPVVEEPSLPPPVPVAPPFPFTFFGKYEQAGGQTVLLFARADRVYDVHVGDVLDNAWSVDEVAQGKVQVTYLPLQTRQSLTLGSAQ